MRFRKDNELVDNEKSKNYNQHLTRALKTLEYIHAIEFNSKAKKNPIQTKELENLKENIQRQILRLSKQIKEYNSHQNISVAV